MDALTPLAFAPDALAQLVLRLVCMAEWIGKKRTRTEKGRMIGFRIKGTDNDEGKKETILTYLQLE